MVHKIRKTLSRKGANVHDIMNGKVIWKNRDIVRMRDKRCKTKTPMSESLYINMKFTMPIKIFVNCHYAFEMNTAYERCWLAVFRFVCPVPGGIQFSKMLHSSFIRFSKSSPLSVDKWMRVDPWLFALKIKFVLRAIACHHHQPKPSNWWKMSKVQRKRSDQSNIFMTYSFHFYLFEI